MSDAAPITAGPRPAAKARREAILLDLTGIPTATGKEHRVISWIERWREGRALRVERDAHGNMLIIPAALEGPPAVLFTAHLDHPAFVVERTHGAGLEAGRIELSFRGGVRQEYFDREPRIVIHSDAGPVRARVVVAEPASEKTAQRRCVAALDRAEQRDSVREGDIATWDIPAPTIDHGLVSAQACDDLAALAAALAAMEELLQTEGPGPSVGVLCTLAEEVGFVGAIGACKGNFIPDTAAVIALENSRSFADSAIGAGPIVRVGDRLSVFSPSLTAAVAKAAETLAKARESTDVPFRWQRKLMPGGACEATCFCAYGYEATCVCLPLGNYHNMGNLERVEAGDKDAADIMPEQISVSDYHGLIDLLVACARGIDKVEPIRDRLERMFEDRRAVLEG